MWNENTPLKIRFGYFTNTY